MISKKLRHETHLDHELREYYGTKWPRLRRQCVEPVKGKEYIADNKKAVLDSQGRHRSEWCYSPYDGRSESPNEKIKETWEILLDRYSGLLK